MYSITRGTGRPAAFAASASCPPDQATCSPVITFTATPSARRMPHQTAVEGRSVGTRRRQGGIVTELGGHLHELRLVGLTQALVGIDAEPGSQISHASPHRRV